MEKIDKEMSHLTVFHQKEEFYDEPNSKFNGISSV